MLRINPAEKAPTIAERPKKSASQERVVMSFSFFQFFTSPILGKLSDHFGRKPLLIITQISTCISFLILGYANTIWLLLLSRIVDGLFGSNLVIARAYLTDITTKKDRSKAFGLSNAAYAFGFMLGPGIGGFLANLTPLSFRLPSLIAAGISFITILFTIFFIKETVKKKKKIKISFNIFPFASILKYLKNVNVSLLLIQLFLLSFGNSIAFETFALFANMHLGLSALVIGYILVYLSILAVLINGIFISKLINYLGEMKLKNISQFFFLIGLIIVAFSKNTFVLLLGLTIYMIGGMTTTILMGEISRRISNKEQGEILGVQTSLRGITEIIGPLVGGFMLNYFIPNYLILVAAFFAFIGLLINFISNRNIHSLNPK